MDSIESYLGNNNKELDIKALIGKLLAKWYLYVIFVPICILLAVVYVKRSSPVYEINTTLLIDDNEKNRTLGDSKYVEGGVGLINSRNNLETEIGILASFNLARQTVKSLDLGITYHSKELMRSKEWYGYFPFVVDVDSAHWQLMDVPIFITFTGENTYSIKVGGDKYNLYKPEDEGYRWVEKKFEAELTGTFGEMAEHDFFKFSIQVDPNARNAPEFRGKTLFFMMHDTDGIATGYKNKLVVEPVNDDASIIQISTQGTVVQKEVDYLEAICKTYIQIKLAERNQIAENRIKFIENQLNNISDSLRNAESILEDFRVEEKAVDLGITATNALAQLQELETEEGELQINQKYYEKLLVVLEDSLSIDRIVAPSSVRITDPVLNDLILELKRLNTEKVGLSFTATQNSYEWQMINKQISTTKQTIKANVESILNSNSYALENTRSRLAKVRGTINKLPKNEQKMIAITRDVAMKDNFYNYFQEKYAEAGIARAEDNPDTKVLDAPRMVGDGPISPKKKLMYAFAFMLGLLIPTGIVILLDMMNDTVTDPAQIERIVKSPVCVSIGHASQETGKLVQESDDWQIEESFRDLSANLQFIETGGDEKMIGVTSTVSGEGKTFTASNLSVILAQSGKKTLLIDLDLRKPSFSEYFRKLNGKGISSYLNGESEYISEIICDSQVKNLHIIPSYPNEGNPHHLINSPRMLELISTVKEEYDYVVFDTPPVGLVSDYLLISKYLDISLYVVRHAYSKLKFLYDLERLKDRGTLQNLYIVYNDVKAASIKYGYYGYGYGYKAGNGAHSKKLIENS